MTKRIVAVLDIKSPKFKNWVPAPVGLLYEGNTAPSIEYWINLWVAGSYIMMTSAILFENSTNASYFMLTKSIKEK